MNSATMYCEWCGAPTPKNESRVCDKCKDDPIMLLHRPDLSAKQFWRRKKEHAATEGVSE